MKVSLVTTVRDEATTIAELHQAVAGQTRPPDEWIVVDGGSRDGTPARLAVLGGCRVVVEPGNIAHGRNRAIAAARHEIVAVVDGGCRPRPRWLERLTEPLAGGGVDAAFGPTIPRLSRPFDAAQWTLLDQFWSRGARWRGPTPSSRSVVFRRALWETTAYPEWLDHGEDRWLFDEWRRRGAALRAVGDPEAAVEWALRESPMAFLRQHWRYARGDGRGGLRPLRNGLRALFYLGVAMAAAVPGGVPLAAGLWAAYLGATVAVRLPEATRGRSPRFRVAALLWTLPALAGMDAAKLAGWAAGAVERAGTANRR